MVVGCGMRGAVTLAAVVLVVTLGLDSGELLAQAHRTAIVTSMSASPDPAQLKSAAITWLEVTVSSTPFIIGTVTGILIAEATRFSLKWLLRAFGAASSAVGFVVRYRLIATALACGIYYIVTNHVMA